MPAQPLLRVLTQLRQEILDPEALVRAVASGRAWISAVQVGGRIGVRACVTNHRSRSADAHALVQVLADARHAAS